MNKEEINKAFDEEYIKYRDAFPKDYDIPALTQTEQDGECKYCTDGCPACDVRKLPEQPKVRTGDCLLVGICASEGHKIQPQRTWVGLTEEEQLNVFRQLIVKPRSEYEVYKAYEMALKEKNT